MRTAGVRDVGALEAAATSESPAGSSAEAKVTIIGGGFFFAAEKAETEWSQGCLGADLGRKAPPAGEAAGGLGGTRGEGRDRPQAGGFGLTATPALQSSLATPGAALLAVAAEDVTRGGVTARCADGSCACAVTS